MLKVSINLGSKRKELVQLKLFEVNETQFEDILDTLDYLRSDFKDQISGKGDLSVDIDLNDYREAFKKGSFFYREDGNRDKNLYVLNYETEDSEFKISLCSSRKPKEEFSSTTTFFFEKTVKGEHEFIFCQSYLPFPCDKCFSFKDLEAFAYKSIKKCITVGYDYNLGEKELHFRAI